jgi:hypothetical protein
MSRVFTVPTGSKVNVTIDDNFWEDFGGFVWQEDITYKVNNIISYEGIFYKCIQISKGKIPSTETSYWTIYQEGFIKIGSTTINLGDTVTTLTGLTSVAATTFTGSLTGNAATATKLATTRTFSLTTDVTGSATFDGTGNCAITATVVDNSHNHTSANISDATNLNTANMIVKRDGSGNFSAGTITAALTGHASSDLALTGGTITGITTFNEPAAGYVKVASTAAPTVDMFQITNAGFGTITAGTNALSVNYVGGAAAVEGSASRFDITPGATSGGTWNSIRLVNGASTTGVTTNGIKLDTKTAGAGTANGIWIGTGWDNIINYNGTTVINGTGNVIAGQLSGTIPSAVLGNSSIYIGTTPITLNRASGALTLAGLSIGGVAATATALATGRTIGMTGDVTWTSPSFNGTGNITAASTLSNTGVTAGTYGPVTVDSKGRITSAWTPSYGMIYADLLKSIKNTYLILDHAGPISGMTHTPANGTLTVPSTGIYQIFLSGSAIVISGGTAGQHTLEVRRNSETSQLTGLLFNGNLNNAMRLAYSISGVASLNSGDIIKIYQTTAATSVDYFNIILTIYRIA